MTLFQSSRIRQSARRRVALDFDFSILSQRANKLYGGALLALAISVVAGCVGLMGNNVEWILPYLMITVPSVAMMWYWTTTQQKGLPLLPIFILQHAVIYAAPLAFDNPNLMGINSSVVADSGLAVLLFLIATLAGWWLGLNASAESKPSQWNLGLAEGTNAIGRCLSLSFLLLGVALMFHLSCRTGLIFRFVPGGLFPVVRTFADAASALGGMLGALVIGGNPRHAQKWIFWSLVASVSLFSITDILISGATGVVIAVAAGLAFGMRRIPWRFLLVAFGIIGFLNQGKFVMRQQYWSEESYVTNVSLFRTPEFFGQWIEASSEMFFDGSGKASQMVEKEDDGQSILDRIDNLQNLNYVIEVMQNDKIRPLNGETYTLVPKLLIPRLLWPGKPRTHEGQVLLNLHFGRQGSVEQTERTYIAWGILPEAVGNFGRILGPVLVGAAIGFMIGLTEFWSRKIRIFSVEGILLLALLLKLAASFEMVASILVTSVFQFLIASAAGGFFLYYWFGAGRSQGNDRSKKRRSTRSVRRSGSEPEVPLGPPKEIGSEELGVYVGK